MRRTLLALLLTVAATPGWACMNDREVERNDADFRAAYGDAMADGTQFGRRVVLGGLIALGVGAAGLTAAGLVLRRREQARHAQGRR